jgi:hypothetical protein
VIRNYQANRPRWISGASKNTWRSARRANNRCRFAGSLENIGQRSVLQDAFTSLLVQINTCAILRNLIRAYRLAGRAEQLFFAPYLLQKFEILAHKGSGAWLSEFKTHFLREHGCPYFEAFIGS